MVAEGFPLIQAKADFGAKEAIETAKGVDREKKGGDNTEANMEMTGQGDCEARGQP